MEALPERVALITENCSKFELKNVTVIHGTAPEVFDQLPQVDRAFIGGSGSKLTEIIEGFIPKLRPDGRVVMTAVTLETLNLAIKIMSQPPFHDFEGLSVNLAELLNLKDLHLFHPGHAIYVLAASIQQEQHERNFLWARVRTRRSGANNGKSFNNFKTGRSGVGPAEPGRPEFGCRHC